MSADNLIYVFPFKKETGQVVWRVTELRLSGLDYELYMYSSTLAKERQFKEYEGKDAYNQAQGYAKRLERYVGICEYGISSADSDARPFTFLRIKRRAQSQGYRLEDHIEASDPFLKKLPKSYWLEAL